MSARGPGSPVRLTPLPGQAGRARAPGVPGGAEPHGAVLAAPRGWGVLGPSGCAGPGKLPRVGGDGAVWPPPGSVLRSLPVRGRTEPRVQPRPQCGRGVGVRGAPQRAGQAVRPPGLFSRLLRNALFEPRSLLKSEPRVSKPRFLVGVSVVWELVKANRRRKRGERAKHTVSTVFSCTASLSPET